MIDGKHLVGAFLLGVGWGVTLSAGVRYLHAAGVLP